jgi:signal transduction histidine kinase
MAAAGAARAWLGLRARRIDRMIGPVVRRWTSLPRIWRALLAPIGVALLWRLAAWQAAGVATGGQPDLGTIVLVSGLHTMPLLLCSWRPLLALLPILVATAIAAGSWPVWPIACAVALAVALYAVATRYDRKIAIGAAVLAVAAVLPATGNSYSGLGPLVPPLVAGLSAVVLVAADNVRSRRYAEAALAEQQTRYQEEQARRAVLEERSRIARELHDVVAHHMSMIAVQAETAPYRIGDLPEASLRDYAAIGATARGALTEMRRLLGVLRSEDDPAHTAPQPGIEQLAELVEGAGAAGMAVRLRVVGAARPVPAAVGLSAFRIVQEALSNAGRHAPGAAVEVTVASAADQLEVTVVDDGNGAGGAAAGTAPAARHGLLGMSERVAMLGGVLDAGPVPGGGFRVRALLPIDKGGAPEAPPDGAEPAAEDGRA